MGRMNLSPNTWSCLPTSVANAIHMDVEDFIYLLGHDGSACPYPPPDTNIKRGFHTQECINVLVSMGYTATPIEAFPKLTPYKGGPSTQVFENPWEAFSFELCRSRGFICGSIVNGRGHAVSNIKGIITDPMYYKTISYKYDCMESHNFKPLVYYRVEKCTL